MQVITKVSIFNQILSRSETVQRSFILYAVDTEGLYFSVMPNCFVCVCVCVCICVCAHACVGTLASFCSSEYMEDYKYDQM